MTDIVTAGSGVLFMKVGTHANESLDDIVRRKRREIEEAGFALWGYGGNTCHPVSMVQPFARTYERKGQTIYLCMHPMTSRHFAVTERATELSIDGIQWERIPDPINVLGSRYALAIRGLKTEEFDLPLSRSRVAVGTSMGRVGSRYVLGHVDKACLEMTDDNIDEPTDESNVHIGLVAELVEPFAVFVRNTVNSPGSAEPVAEPH
jgi:hypothetical protein